MEKQRLNRFVQKYTLNGLIESVKWESDNKSLHTSFISDDKSVLGNVEMSDFDFDKTEFGVYDTTKLKNMLSVLGNDVEFKISSANNKAASLEFSDKSTAINYMLADLSVIPNVPDLKKLPDFDIKIKLDDTVINKFIKAKSALTDENNFAFITKNGKSTIVIGHSNINTNKISIEVEATTDGDVSPMYFSATYLKEILVANKDASDATLNISSHGLAHIQFEIDEYKSNYYLVKIEA
jgi:hypothetical protein